MKTTAWLVAESTFRLTAKLVILWSRQVGAQPNHMYLFAWEGVFMCAFYTCHLSHICVLPSAHMFKYVYECLFLSVFDLSSGAAFTSHASHAVGRKRKSPGNGFRAEACWDCGIQPTLDSLTGITDCTRVTKSKSEIPNDSNSYDGRTGIYACGHERECSYCSQHWIYQFKLWTTSNALYFWTSMAFVEWTPDDIKPSLLFLFVIAHSDKLYKTSHRDDNSACFSKMF